MGHVMSEVTLGDVIVSWVKVKGSREIGRERKIIIKNTIILCM